MADAIPRKGRDDFLADLLLAFENEAGMGFGEVLRYDHLRSRWLIWNGVRWRPDRSRQVYDAIREVGGELWKAALANGEESTVKMLDTLFDTSRKEGVLKSLSARESIRMDGDEWDRNPYLVGFENGIMDLESGQWYAEPDPALLVSKSVGVDWDPAAECPTFEQFLDDVMGGDAELVAYLKRLIGYSLLGSTSEQKFWMWVGRGSNGKGVLARTLNTVYGEYADTPSETMYMRTKLGAARSDAARPDLLRLQSIRYVYMSEPPGHQFNEELLKAHTGEDMILARNLYARAEQMAQFAPTHKIVFLTNDPPKTDDVGVSMSRRVRVVRFEQDYSVNPDRTLEERLRKEHQGILNLAIREALAWIAEGMPEPDKVLAWSREYIEENDPLSQFISERCEVGRQLTGASHSLWASYEDWAAQRSEDPMSQTGFGLAMSRKFKKVKRNTGAVYLGVRAKSAVELAGG